MLKTFICLVLTASLSNSALAFLNLVTDINTENTIITDERMECVLKVIDKNIHLGAVINVITVDEPFDNNLLKAISKENCYSLLTRSMSKTNWLIPTDAYLILIEDISELPVSLSELSRDLLWNPRAKFIITLPKTAEGDIRQIFNLLLNYRIYKVFVLSSVNSDKIQLSTYFPFENNNCGRRFDDVLTLQDCTNVTNSDTLIPDQNLNKYRNCTIVVGIHEVVPYVVTSENKDLNISKEYKYGIEQIILESIAQLEGINIEYKFFSSDVNRGIVLENNTGTGILSYLQNGEISLAVGGFILILNRVLICDFIWGYNYADLKIVTPTTTEVVWKKVYRTFGIQSWIYIACSFCIISVATLLILKLLSPNKHQSSISTVMKLLDYLLDHSDDGLFSNRNLRLLLICWIWYTYFINSFYKTAYYSLITGHVKEKRDYEPSNLSTFPFDPCINDVGRNFFIYAYNLTFPYKERIERCQSTDSSLNYVVEKREHYTVATEYTYYLKAPKYIDEEGNFKLDSWDILSGTISSLYCTRGFELRRRFQKHAMHIFESGLLQFRLGMMKVKRRHFTQSNKKYFKKLHFGDFRISYYILIIGSIISCLCFILEVYY